MSNSDIRYDDVFSEDIIKQKEVTDLYSELLRIREDLIESTPVAITGPLH